jgi:hypothetical protein
MIGKWRVNNMYMPPSATPVDNNMYMPPSATPADESSQPESWGTEALNAINQVGGTIAHGAAYIAQDAANPIINLGNQLYKGAAQQAGINPNNVAQNPQWDASKLPMPGVAPARASELDTLARPAATAAEWAIPAYDATKLGLALTSAGGKALLKKLTSTSAIKNLSGQNIEEATKKFGSEAKNALTDLFGESKISPRDELQQNTHEALQQMYGTPDYKNMIGNENEILSKKVQDAYNTNYKIGNDRYNTTLADTNPIVSPEDAHIKPREGTQLDKAMQMDSILADKIIAANKTPNLRNLHEVQSQMGSMIADKKSVPYNQQDKESINLLQNLKDKIVDNISSHAPQYKADTAFWRNNIIPYQQNSSINRLVRKNIVPSNISNILSKPELSVQRNELPGTVNTILSHLSPQDKQLIPAAKLAGTQANPLVDSSGNLDADKFAKNAQGLNIKNIQQFLSPEVKQKLQGLGKDLKDAQLHDAITNNVKDISGKINPDQLVKNIQGLDSKLISPTQKATLQQSLSKLTGMSENIKKEQLKTDAIKKLLSKAGWLGGGALGGLGIGEAIHKIL